MAVFQGSPVDVQSPVKRVFPGAPADQKTVFPGASVATSSEQAVSPAKPAPATTTSAAEKPGADVLHPLKTIGGQIKGSWEALKSDWEKTQLYGKDTKPKGFWDRQKALFDSFIAAGKLPVDAFNLAISPLTGAIEAGITKPISAVTGIKESDVDTALLALGPGRAAAARAAEALMPAARKPTGEIVPGTKGGVHDDIPGIAPKDERGFVGGDGKFQTRKDATATAKAAGLDVPEKLHSEDLNKARAAEDAKLTGPGPILDPPPGVETVKGTATRLDDALYRIRKNGTADKIEATRFLESVPKEIMDPKVQARLYAEIENRMVKSGAPLSPEAQAAFDVLKPWKDEEAKLFRDIKERGGEMSDAPLQTEGYVHRKVQGKGSYFDPADPESFHRADPVIGGTLSKKASSLQPRKFFVLETPDGRRVFQKAPGPDWEHGKAIRGSDGKPYTPKLATTAEIEANTGTRYFKNATVNTVDNVLRLRRVKRNLDLLDELKPQLLDKNLAMTRKEGAEIPHGWIEPTIPQFKGWVMEPKIAHVLNDFHGELLRGGALDQFLSRVNRVMVGSLFMMPGGVIAHGGNVMNHWIVGRGWEWMKPSGMASLMRNGTRAIKAVVTQNDDYVKMLREGSGLLYADVANQNFYKLMIEKMGNEQVADPQTWAGIAKTLGFSSIADMVKWEYRAMAKSLWAISDAFMLQRQFELMDKGLPVREAIRQAERDIPNYRVPSEVMGSRAMAELLKGQKYLIFGRYKYGQFRAYATMLEDMVKGSGEERKEAIGKLLVLGLSLYAAFPLADLAVQKITGNKDAKLYRRGASAIPQAVYDLTEGQKDWVSAVSSIITPSPVLQGGLEMMTNRDVFGRPIVEPGSTGLGKAVQAAEYAGEQFGPVSAIEQVAKPGGMEPWFARELGVKIPSPAAKRGKALGKRRELRAGLKRERRDPFEQGIRKLIEGDEE